MSVSSLHTLYAVLLNTETLGGSSVLFDQIQSFSISTGLSRIMQRGDGDVDPTYVSIMSQRPMFGFTTTALATALGSCGIGGAEIDNGTYPGIECWFQAMSEGGVRATGSSHFKMTGAQGILVPRSIQAAQDGVATVAFEAILTYDGSHEPIVFATSQALSGSPSVGELFTVGPVSINGAALTAIQGITVDPGISLITAAGDGDVWPTYVAIQSRDPSIRVSTTDVTALSTYGLDGTAQGATDSVVFFRKLAEGGTRTAEATAEHISITVDDGMITVENASVSQDGVASGDLVITPSYDGSNAIIAISAAAAIA
ncbi:MAG TPA: hypothetical protein VMX12_09135 [Acidimicrobiia bacterium]|nr:hypothetical protein [Acidimicrobiia bacterium]